MTSFTGLHSKQVSPYRSARLARGFRQAIGSYPATEQASVIRRTKHAPVLSTGIADFQVAEMKMISDSAVPGMLVASPQESWSASEVGYGFASASYLLMKRLMDLSIAMLAIVLLSPLMLVVAAAIKLTDFGPVFFKQVRVGQDGREFLCWKFRSMVMNAEALMQELAEKNQHSDPRTFKMANDPRITAIGRILRRFSIDELPQIFNVLMGDMSIVGPRPPLPREVELYSAEDWRRLEVKPGLTCLWQISGRSRLPFPEQVRLDVQYIERRSLLLDCLIIARTVPAVLGGDGAV